MIKIKVLKKIPIIDLFAGPGGLGEGFSSLVDERGRSIFDIKLAIEKDVSAHKTLTLRSFFRQFKKKGEAIPKEYYDVIKENSLKKREALISRMLDSFPEGLEAKNEACLVELGSKEWSAERIQTFPDNYLFRGSRTNQFHQVGNAVPPYLASHISRIVKNILEV